MFRSLEELIGYQLRALDGDLGRVEDFFFDDSHWLLRYLAADTGGWISGRQVLISPVEVEQPEWVEQVLPVRLTREQIKNSPPIDAALPVSRQQEIELAEYYGWPFYWGVGSLPTGTMSLSGNTPDSPHPVSGDPHLRSVRQVIGYTLEGVDGRAGRIEDFIVKTEDWSIAFLVADLRPRLPDKRVLLEPRAFERRAWEENRMRVGLTFDQLAHSPEFDPHAPVNRQVQIRRYDYYGRPAPGG